MPLENLTITVLGSGTSVGVPVIGCDCETCSSDDPRDTRTRPSVLVSFEAAAIQRHVVIDTTPDFRQQALRARFRSLDAILYTHSHADHIMGMDDVRPYNYGRTERLPAYARADTAAVLRRVFPYALEEVRTHPGGVPRVDLHEIDSAPIPVAGLEFEPIPVLHGPNEIVGYRFGNAAYLTDHSDIPADSLPRLEGLDVLFLDALRPEPHPMHSTLEQALGWVERLRPNRAYFTHVSCRLPHERTSATLPENVHLAYDGLRIEVG